MTFVELSAPLCTDLFNFGDTKVLVSRFFTVTVPSSYSQPCLPSCTFRIMRHDGYLSFKFARVDLLTAGDSSCLENYRDLMVYHPSY